MAHTCRCIAEALANYLLLVAHSLFLLALLVLLASYAPRVLLVAIFLAAALIWAGRLD